MAGEGENTGGENNAGEGGKDDGDKQEKFTPVTYDTQEKLDAAFAERATRAANAAKADALKAFQEAGATPEDALKAWTEVKAAEDAKKDPAVREREAHEETRRKLQALEAKESRATLSKDVAKDLKIGETPIPADLLAGTTKEEMEAHGKSIIAFVEQLVGKPGVRRPGYNPDAGNNHQDTVTTGDPIRNLFETGSFQ